MRCPNGDNILVEKSPVHDGMSLHYLFCPSCFGHWLSAFDANYLRSIDLPNSPALPASQGTPFRSYACPQCRRKLERATGENIPEDVLTYRCPEAHGYFFPTGELKKFKEAQEVKLAYHTKWRVPLTSVASALLMSLFGLILSAGLVLGVIEGQRQQTMTSQAEELITSHKTYSDNHGATIIAITSQPVDLTAVVNGKDYPMLAPDNKSHVVRITDLPPGNHQYRFRFQKEGRTLESSVYSFFSF